MKNDKFFIFPIKNKNFNSLCSRGWPKSFLGEVTRKQGEEEGSDKASIRKIDMMRAAKNVLTRSAPKLAF